MKKVTKVLLALLVAAPINLVSAVEPGIGIDSHALNQSDDNEHQASKDQLILTPMRFEEVVVIAPRLDKSVLMGNKASRRPLMIIKDDLSDVSDVALAETPSPGDTEVP